MCPVSEAWFSEGLQWPSLIISTNIFGASGCGCFASRIVPASCYVKCVTSPRDLRLFCLRRYWLLFGRDALRALLNRLRIMSEFGVCFNCLERFLKSYVRQVCLFGDLERVLKLGRFCCGMRQFLLHLHISRWRIRSDLHAGRALLVWLRKKMRQ